MIKVSARTIQRLMDLLPTKTGLNQPVDDFLLAIHTKVSDALTKLSTSEDDMVQIIIRITKE